jgi:hypothetical protein
MKDKDRLTDKLITVNPCTSIQLEGHLFQTPSMDKIKNWISRLRESCERIAIEYKKIEVLSNDLKKKILKQDNHLLKAKTLEATLKY